MRQQPFKGSYVGELIDYTSPSPTTIFGRTGRNALMSQYAPYRNEFRVDVNKLATIWIRNDVELLADSISIAVIHELTHWAELEKYLADQSAPMDEEHGAIWFDFLLTTLFDWARAS